MIALAYHIKLTLLNYTLLRVPSSSAQTAVSFACYLDYDCMLSVCQELNDTTRDKEEAGPASIVHVFLGVIAIINKWAESILPLGTCLPCMIRYCQCENIFYVAALYTLL